MPWNLDHEIFYWLSSPRPKPLVPKPPRPNPNLLVTFKHERGVPQKPQRVWKVKNRPLYLGMWECHRGCPRHHQRPMLKDQISFPLFGFHLGLDFEIGLGLWLVNIQFHSNVSRLRCPITVSLWHPRSGHYIFYWKALLGSFHSFLFFIPGWHRTMRHILLDLWQTFMDWNTYKIGTSVFIRTHF